MEHGHGKVEGHIVGFGTYVLVWAALIMLTALTVAVAGINLSRLSVATAVLVAAVKTSLVLWIFMHLKYEDKVFKWMFLAVVITLAIFMLLTFSDDSLVRQPNA